ETDSSAVELASIRVESETARSAGSIAHSARVMSDTESSVTSAESANSETAQVACSDVAAHLECEIVLVRQEGRADTIGPATDRTVFDIILFVSRARIGPGVHLLAAVRAHIIGHYSLRARTRISLPCLLGTLSRGISTCSITKRPARMRSISGRVASKGG